MKRRREQEAQEKATYDYILGDLIGRSLARIYNSENHYPEIYEAYPSIFDKEKIEYARQEELNRQTAERLQRFMESFNSKKEGKIE